MPLARSLWDNSVGPEGAKALGEALTMNKTLKTLKYAAAHLFPYCQQPLTSALLALNSLSQHGPESDWCRGRQAHR